MNCAKEPVVIEKVNFRRHAGVKMINCQQEDHYASSENETILYHPVPDSDNDIVPCSLNNSSLDSFKPKRNRKKYATGNQQLADSNWKIETYFDTMDGDCHSGMKVLESESTLLQNMHDSDTESKSSIESMNIIKYPSLSVLSEIEHKRKEKLQALEVKNEIQEDKVQNLHNLSRKNPLTKRNKVDPHFSKTSGTKLKQKSKLCSSKERKKSLPIITKESYVTQKKVKASVSKKYKDDFEKKFSSKKSEFTLQGNPQLSGKSGSIFKHSEKKQSITNSSRFKNKASHLVKENSISKPRKSGDYECHSKSLKANVKTSLEKKSCLQYKEKCKNIEKVTIKSSNLQKRTHSYKQSTKDRQYSTQHTPPVTDFLKNNLPEAESVVSYSSPSNEITETYTCKDIVENNKSVIVPFNKETGNYYFKFIRRIVGMNTKWLKEREGCNFQNTEPFEVSKGAALLPAFFNSYGAYASSFFPMVILEVWEELCRKSKPLLIDKNERIFYFAITSSSIKSGLLKLQCESIVNSISYEPLKNDLVILNLKLSSEALCSAFGFITKHEYLQLHENIQSTTEWSNLPNNWVTNAKFVKFNVYVKSREASPLLKTLMKGSGLCNLEHRIKRIDALNNLKSSPLLKDMLVPKWNTFCVPCSGKVNGNLYPDVRDSVSESVCKAMLLPPSENKIVLLQGPPGSGKTGIIINILESLVYGHDYRKKILVTAPSNAAVDEIGNQLIELNEMSSWRDFTLKFIRVGSLCNIQENLKPYALAQRLELRRLNAENKRSQQELEYFDIQNELLSLQGTMDEKRCKMQNELEVKYQYMQKTISDKWDPLVQTAAILQDAHVILLTLEDCLQLNEIKDSLDLSCCIVDEINQTTEFEFLLPLTLGINKFFITGDPMQLPAIVESHLAIKCGFQKSVLERCHMYFMSNFQKSPLIILAEQFRMNASICYFPLKYIYHRDIPSLEDCQKKRMHFALISYMVLDDKMKLDRHSAYYDETGVTQIIKICEYVRKKSYTPSIGIIVPSNEIKEHYTSAISECMCSSHIKVDTVYGFQGQTKPVIILSCFQTGIHGGQSYFSCKRELNVALTRASESLILCGAFNNVSRLPEMDLLISDAIMRDCYFPYSSVDALSSILKGYL